MHDRRRQLDVAHALAADAAVRHLDAAAVANHAFILHAAVLAAGALPVFLGAKNTFAEQTVFFGTICAIVDRLRFLDFAKGPAANIVGAGQANANRPIIIDPVIAAFTGTHIKSPRKQDKEFILYRFALALGFRRLFFTEAIAFGTAIITKSSI